MSPFFEYGFNVVTAATSLAAIGYTAREARRNNRAVVKIESVSCTYTQNLSGSFTELKFLLRNCGISLHDLEASLAFVSSQGYGSLQAPLTRQSRTSGLTNEFTKGMIATFTLRTSEMDDGRRRFLADLKSPAKQDAYLCIYSQGYLAQEFRIGSLWDRLKVRWNHFAATANHALKREMCRNERNHPVVKYYKLLPMAIALDWEVRSFIESLNTKDPFSQAA